MATFYDNLRASADQSSPDKVAFNSRQSLSPMRSLPKWGALQSPEETTREFQVDAAQNAAEKKVDDQERSERIKETIPLRNAIKDASGGKVMVDDSIYNEEELQSILNTVRKMGKYNNGALFPGYTIISNSDGFDDWQTEGKFYSGDKLNIYGFAPFPNGFYGTKNNPYRIYLKDANYPWTTYSHYDDDESGWHPRVGEVKDSSDHTATHELSHSAHKEALKKSHAPTLWMSPEEDEAYKKLTSKFSNFRDLVQKLTDENHLENTKSAAASVSGYAKASHDKDVANKELPFAELFAEAYSDVLYNGDSARPYSKALVEAYSEYLNEYNAIFDSEINRIRKQFNNNSFVDNLRRATPKINSGPYIVK